MTWTFPPRAVFDETSEPGRDQPSVVERTRTRPAQRRRAATRVRDDQRASGSDECRRRRQDQTNLARSSQNHHSFSLRGRGLFSCPPALSLVGTIVRFPRHPPLDRRTVGGATPTLLGRVPSGGICGSAHRLTSDRVCNGDRVESETGRGRFPILADWLRRHTTPTLDSAHMCACWRALGECHEQSVVAVRVKMALLL